MTPRELITNLVLGGVAFVVLVRVVVKQGERPYTRVEGAIVLALFAAWLLTFGRVLALLVG